MNWASSHTSLAGPPLPAAHQLACCCCRGRLQVLAGGLSGVLAWLPIYPLDVIKTRVQAVAAAEARGGGGGAGGGGGGGGGGGVEGWGGGGGGVRAAAREPRCAGGVAAIILRPQLYYECMTIYGLEVAVSRTPPLVDCTRSHTHVLLAFLRKLPPAFCLPLQMLAEGGPRVFFRGMSPTLARAFIMDGASFLGYTATLRALGGGQAGRGRG